MDGKPNASMLKLTSALFVINAIVWLIFGIMSFALALKGGNSIRWMLSVMMVINVCLMAWFGVQIRSGSRRIFFLAILYVVINVVLSITDQFGWIDAAILLLNLVLLGLLFVTHSKIGRVEQTE